ncbi:MAG: acylphosphatase [bacterium]
MEKTVKVIIKGYVQGVGFRYWAYRHATALGIKGYVRNCSDGTVEVLASGEAQDVEQFLRVLSRGPSGAIVEELEIKDISGPVKYSSFFIRYD